MNIKAFFSVLVFICLVTLCCRNNDEKTKNSEKIMVRTIKPKKVAVSFPVRASGTLASKAEMKLSFKTGGIIDNIYVDEGQVVNQGQLLAQLNFSEIGTMTDQARLGYEKAKRDLQRAENLYRDSVATLEQLQNATTAIELAASQLKIAEFNAQFSKIVAPAKGKVLKKLAEENEMIAPGYPLFLFSSSESDWVLRTSVADIDIVKIGINDSAKICFDAFPGSTFNAVVSEIAKASDPYTGTYEIELRLTRKHPYFVSGLIGKVEITPSDKNDYVVLPLDVIHDAHEMEGYIYLVRDSSFERKHIRLLNLTDSLVYIPGDFLLSEIVISDGADYLISGSVIEIVE
mgnify:CR=1 FL=1